MHALTADPPRGGSTYLCRGARMDERSAFNQEAPGGPHAPRGAGGGHRDG